MAGSAQRSLRPAAIGRGKANVGAAWPTRSRTAGRWLMGLALLGVFEAGQAAHEPDRLEALIQAGQHEQAYKLAAKHRSEHAGQRRFDLYYGLAALETGHIGEAVFALERVLIAQPGLDRARLAHARGLFLQGEDRRARREFETVLAHNPAPALVDRIERYLAAIDRRSGRYRTRLSGHIETALGHDDNVNRAPAGESVDLGFATLVLDERSRAREDAFYRLGGGVDVSHPVHPGVNLVANGYAKVRDYDDASAFDTQRLGGRGGLRYRTGAHRVAAYLEAQRLAVGHDPYLDAGGLSLLYRQRVDKRLSVHTLGRLTQLRYEDQESLDSTLGRLGVGFSMSWGGAWNPSTRFTVYAGAEEAANDSRRAQALAERDMAGVRARFALQPAPAWTLRSSLSYRTSEYAADARLFGEAREADDYSLDLALDWQPSEHWRIGPQVSYANKDANIGLYDYERTAVSLRARYLLF